MKPHTIAAIVVISGIAVGFFRCGNDSGSSVHLNHLSFQKADGEKAIGLNYDEFIMVNEEEEIKMCYCRALVFRMLQVLSREWADGIVRTYELEGIQTGWNTPDIKEVFNALFGKAPVKVTIAEGSTPNAYLGRKDNWFLVTFKSGKQIEIRASERLYTERYFELRGALQRGEKELYLTEAMNEKKDLEKRFREMPLGRMFTVQRR
ncbi:MAG: hypothetical protein JXA20_10980 [Spirochaetes bacterium]|nr:hypothetical protein [Spirochaetota bacterium]